MEWISVKDRFPKANNREEVYICFIDPIFIFSATFNCDDDNVCKHKVNKISSKHYWFFEHDGYFGDIVNKNPLEDNIDYCSKISYWMKMPKKDADGWIDIKDEKPELNKSIICLDDNDDVFEGVYIQQNDWIGQPIGIVPVSSDYFYDHAITHWMPLPNIPKEDNVKKN